MRDYSIKLKSLDQIATNTQLEIEVKESDTASFYSGQVHPVYATFALGRDAEWTTRQFVLDLKEEIEEGIGTYLNIKHISPAFVGEKVIFNGIVESLEGNHLHCSFEAFVNERKIAEGTTGQKVILKDKLEAYFKKVQNG